MEQSDILKKYKKYKIKKKKTFNEICFPKSYELQNSQLFVPQYIYDNNQSLLVYHKIGSGKTCTGIQIAEKFKGKRKIYFILPASLIPNLYNEILSLCTGDTYLTIKEKEMLNKLNPETDRYINIYNKGIENINKYYNIYSYHKFVGKIKTINLNNSIIILDEIHNIISLTGSFYKKINEKIQKSKNLIVVGMTATPIYDKVNELALTLNLISQNNILPVGSTFMQNYLNITTNNNKLNIKMIHKTDLEEKINGYVSYFKGAPDYTFPKQKLKIVKCKMSDFQFKAYLSVSKEVKNSSFIDLFNLPNDFYINSRMVLNIAYPNKLSKQDGFKSINEKTIKDLKNFSIKIFTLLQNINKQKGTIFIYSNFKEYGGIYVVKRILELSGYYDYADNGVGENRFAMWSGDEKIEYKKNVNQIFNNSKNIDGSQIKIILGSPSIKEGVSLKRVRAVHILDPYWNWSRLDQIIGRAIRYCSHKDLDKKDRNVDVYIYIGVGSNGEKTVDGIILELADSKKEVINKFEKILQKCAIDKSLY